MIIPETIRKKFIAGWREHIPLTYLTDQNCARTAVDPEANHDLLTVSSSAGLITTTSKPLSAEGEANLSFREWCEAWKRLLRLIQDYSPAEYDIWSRHHNRIRDAEDCTTKWSLWLAYDIEIRRRSCTEPLDPSIFQVNIWNDLQPDFLIRQAMERLRSQYTSAPSSSSTLKRRHSPERRDLPNKRPREYTTSDEAERFRCFLCAGSNHSGRYCRNTKLSNGKPTYLRFAGPNKYADPQGRRYCFSFNGNGCQIKYGTCRQGLHKCSLCGGEHTAQVCKDF
ncbi:hypothetical protein M422DRAFT_67829 [Sphaerobolus stellatus SS14]|uniref:Uncharacterized protein n=1 Tax=Sphaerobolus stellatus (strain SS14) TaxID=990650 RepID=A0A0C9UKP5_SPHS4|nr:hypothetical protein M422DRAFT_67829 [Sphaerobolus stellatus SS14]